MAFITLEEMYNESEVTKANLDMELAQLKVIDHEVKQGLKNHLGRPPTKDELFLISFSFENSQRDNSNEIRIFYDQNLIGMVRRVIHNFKIIISYSQKED